MLKVLVVDNWIAEIIRQWNLSGCEGSHDLLYLEPFDLISRTLSLVDILKPDVILIGYWLGDTKVTGSKVIRSLRKGGYEGYIIANSSGGIEQFTHAGVEVDGNANRIPQELKKILDNLEERNERR